MQRSITSRIMLPIIVVFVAGVVGLGLFTSSASQKTAVDASIENAKSSINQYKRLRKYYTENVVSKVKKNTDLKVSFDHKGKDATIPLPASMIHDLSELMNEDKSGTKLKLYSSFPFPNRKGRVLDDFAVKALEYYAARPDALDFTLHEQVDGKDVVRVAIADRMVAEACISCHNTHPDSPKKDWKLNDVRGVLEVTAPIDNTLASNKQMMLKVCLIALAGLIVSLGLLGWIVSAAITRPILRISSELGLGAEQVASATSQVASASQDLASGSSEQASSIEETSSSLEEMASMTRQNTDNVMQARVLAEKARVAADGGNVVMDEMNQAMAEIKTASDEVGKIIKTIDDIAFQTNLLALNAAVEAAHAGEAGRGFAVVAEEVRNLARKSADAVKESAAKIETAALKSKMGVETARKVSAALSEISVSVKKAYDLAGEIGASSQEQSQGISQINLAVQQMDKVVQSNAANAEETASAAEEMSTQALALRDAVEKLTQLVGANNSARSVNGSTVLPLGDNK